MQIRLLVNSLMPTMILSVVLVFSRSAFVEQKVSAATDNGSSTQTGAAQTSPCANGKESGLPLPSGFVPAKLSDFQSQL